MDIGTGIYYPLPIHKQPYYKELGYKDSLPVSEIASKEVISLPVHPSLNKLDLDTISGKLREIMG
jgi:perosamine synthetase